MECSHIETSSRVKQGGRLFLQIKPIHTSVAEILTILHALLFRNFLLLANLENDHA